MLIAWSLLVACGAVEPRLSCTSPEGGDLAGYCILGEHDGREAARDVTRRCDTGVEGVGGVAPDEVAEGPGGCDEVDAAVLEAEQAAYVRCWQRAFDEVMAARGDDTGCLPEG